MGVFPQIVTLRITSKCNQDCKYCYGPKCVKELPFSLIKKMVAKFKANDVKGVVITGGEPLMRPDILDIFKEIKENGMKLLLYTNGDFVWDKIEYINKYIDVLSLPLDAADPIYAYRKGDNFNNIMRLLEYYSKEKNRPIIKIGSVITKENFNQMKPIAELLKKFHIDIWKIYQFIPTGQTGNKYKDELLINAHEFQSKADQIINEYSSYFKIFSSRRTQRSAAYFMVDPDGIVFMPTDNNFEVKDVIIGNVFDEDILSRWEKHICRENFVTNSKTQFNDIDALCVAAVPEEYH